MFELIKANIVTIANTMTKSLYAQYMAERESAVLLEHEWGFAIYKVATDHVYLQDIYVVPTERKNGRGVQLMNEVIGVAKSLGHTKLLGSVVPGAPFADRMLRIMHDLDFNLLSSSDGIIYMVKEI